MRYNLLAGICTGALALSAPAMAQSSPPAEGAQTTAKADIPSESQAEIVVTANKRSERLFDVPAAISVLTGARLEASGATQFSQYFDKIPGLSAVPLGQPGRAIVTIRGIGTGASQTNATIGTYINDVPFGSSGGLAIGGQFVADPNTFDIERVEVLKGPQGTLYGASTLGGLIKTVYASPVLGRTEGRVMLDGSAVESGNVGWMANAMVNFPASDTLALRAVVSARRDPGFIDNRSPGNMHDNMNTADAFGARVSALFKPSDQFSAELLALYQRTRSNGVNMVDLDITTLRPTVGDLATAENVIQPHDLLKYQIYSAKLAYDFGPATLTSITSLGRYTENQTLDATDSLGIGPLYPYNTQISLDNFTEELRLASPTGRTFEWMTGLFYTHQDNTWNFDFRGLNPVTQQPLPASSPVANFYTFMGDTTYKEVAAFGNATIHLSDSLSITGGARYAENRQRYTYIRSGLVAGGGTTTLDGNSKEHATTYLASIQYKVDPNTLVYVKTASGYRPGGPQVSNLVGLNLPTTFGPDTTRNYEAGLKTSTLNGALTLDASVFYIAWSNIQLLRNVIVNVNGTSVQRSIISNAGAASSRGFDFDLHYRPIPRLSLGFGGGYTDAHLNDAAPSLGAVAGERLTYTPRWSLNGSVDYSIRLGSETDLQLGATARYVGSRTTYFSADPTGNVPAVMPQYAIVDLRAAVELPSKFEIALRVNNVTNSRAILSATTNSSVPTNPNVWGVVAQPRTYGISLTKSF